MPGPVPPRAPDRAEPVPRRPLLIGIGNPLRGDDGVGWRLVEELERTGGDREPSAHRRVVHQLTPELATDLAASSRVLFIDAWVPPSPHDTGGDDSRARPCLLRLSSGWPAAAGLGGEAAGTGRPPAVALRHSHHLDPQALLAMSASLYDAAPCAHLLRVPAFHFGYGMELSAPLRAHLPRARALLRQWLCHGATAWRSSTPLMNRPGGTPGHPPVDPA